MGWKPKPRRPSCHSIFYNGQRKRPSPRHHRDDPTDAPVLVNTTSSEDHLTADVEGLTIFYGEGASGYLIASSQGDDRFVIYKREAPHDFVLSFQIGIGIGIDRVTRTDGIDVTSAGLSTAFANGMFVAQDTDNDGATQNFKYVPWPSIANLASPPLASHASWNPRQR